MTLLPLIVFGLIIRSCDVQAQIPVVHGHFVFQNESSQRYANERSIPFCYNITFPPTIPVLFITDVAGEGGCEPLRIGPDRTELPAESVLQRWRGCTVAALVEGRDARVTWCGDIWFGSERVFRNWPRKGDPGCKSNRVVGTFPSVISLHNTHTTNWFHFHIDVLSWVLLILAALRNESVVTWAVHPQRPGAFIPRSFGWAGMGERTVPLRPQEYVIAERVYFFVPSARGVKVHGVGLLTRGIQALRNVVAATLHLDSAAPQSHVLMQRSRPPRVVANLHALRAVLLQAVPWSNWTIISAQWDSLEQSAQIANSMRSYFLIHGGGSANAMFLQRRALLVELMSCRPFWSVYRLTDMFGACYAMAWMPGLGHYRDVCVLTDELIRAIGETLATHARGWSTVNHRCAATRDIAGRHPVAGSLKPTTVSCSEDGKSLGLGRKTLAI